MMDSFRNSCRLCLKITSGVNLTPLFENYGYEHEDVAMEWRRMFSFIYNIQGLPDKICNNCKAQAEWILNFHRQCYENDAILRMNQIKTEFHDEQDINALSYIYDKANILEHCQFNETPQEFECDNDDSEKYEDEMPMEDSNETFAEEIPFNLLEQNNFSEETCKIMSDNTKIFEENRSKEEAEHEQMENSTQDLSYIESTVTDNDTKPRRSITQSGSGHICLICGKSFANTSSLNVHRKKHDNPKPFTCTFSGCDKKFSKEMRDFHIKSVHEKRTYKCPLCNHIQKYKHDVAKHIRKMHSSRSGLQPVELEA